MKLVTREFFCVDYADVNELPPPLVEATILKERGLGRKVIQFPKGCSTNKLKNIIRRYDKNVLRLFELKL